MSNDTEFKRCGCRPAIEAVYRAENENAVVQPIVGTAREISEKLGYETGYIRKLAHMGRVTQKGWFITLETPSQWTGVKTQLHREFIAECDDDDPIIGPISEIAELTGLHPAKVLHLIDTGQTSREGWRVRPYIEDSHGFDITPDAGIE